jgi:hypothetical protein
MSFDFTQESRGVVRRRVGRLLFPELDDFGYFIPATAAAGNVTHDSLAIVPDGSLNGAVAMIVQGTGSGQARWIELHTQATKTITFGQNFSPAPNNSDSLIEYWPEYVIPDVINEHINLAIQRISPVVKVYVEQAATLNADRNIVTIPSGWTHVTGVRYVDDVNARLIDFTATLDPWIDPLGFPAFNTRGTSGYLNQVIDSSYSTVLIRGYRNPALPASDADLVEVNPAWLVFMTAYMLDAGKAFGQLLDPEQHAGRATNWFNQAKDIESRIITNWLPDTVPVDS